MNSLYLFYLRAITPQVHQAPQALHHLNEWLPKRIPWNLDVVLKSDTSHPPGLVEKLKENRGYILFLHPSLQTLPPVRFPINGENYKCIHLVRHLLGNL